MTNNKETIYLTPDKLIIVSPELESASEAAGQSLSHFIDWLETFDFGLERHETTILASAILYALPELFKDQPAMISGLKAQAEQIRSMRPQ